MRACELLIPCIERHEGNTGGYHLRAERVTAPCYRFIEPLYEPHVYASAFGSNAIANLVDDQWHNRPESALLPSSKLLSDYAR